MLDKAIIGVFCIVLILMISLVSFDLTFTIVQKISFDNACRNTLYKIDMDGGLKGETREVLIGKLMSCGFENIEIEAPEEVEYGETIDFRVYAHHTDLFKGIYNNLFKTGRFGYENSVTSRKIHNNAF